MAAANCGLAPLRIMIVDDNRDSGDLLGEILQMQGHEVAVAVDGMQALALADSFQPDVAILDIGLPNMDGYELARQLRTRPAATRTRLIAVTGYGQESDRALSSAAGFDSHLVKPVNVAALVTLLAEPSIIR